MDYRTATHHIRCMANKISTHQSFLEQAHQLCWAQPGHIALYVSSIVDLLAPAVEARINLPPNSLKAFCSISMELIEDTKAINCLATKTDSGYHIQINETLLTFFARMSAVITAHLGVIYKLEKKDPDFRNDVTIAYAIDYLDGYWRGAHLDRTTVMALLTDSEKRTAAELAHGMICITLAHELGHVIVGGANPNTLYFPTVRASIQSQVTDYRNAGHFPNLNSIETVTAAWINEVLADIEGIMIALRANKTDLMNANTLWIAAEMMFVILNAVEIFGQKFHNYQPSHQTHPPAILRQANAHALAEKHLSPNLLRICSIASSLFDSAIERRSHS